MNCTYIFFIPSEKGSPGNETVLCDKQENKLAQSRVAEERGWDQNKTRR
jgi:hypothetical protein